jgi:ketosteroid isomerase-like protein
MPTVKDDLIARERDWMEAGQRGDFAALERIVGPDFVYTASGQGRWTRQQWMDTARRYDLRSFAFLDVEVRPYGDVAVVYSRYRQEGFIAGAPRSGEFLITDVWVKRDGAWQVVARSSILMSGPLDAPQAAPPAVIDPKR